METKKITPQEFMQRLRERAEKAKAEGKTTAIPAKHSEILKKLRERAEKMKAEGKTVKSFPAPNARFAELIKKMKEAKLNKIEKKEE